MIPILFGPAKANNSEGIGRLTDAITCQVTEERLGSYELVMTYPVTGQHFADIAPRYQIVTTAFKGSGKQAFRVYKISKPLDGIVTINARHISYDLRNIVVSPFTASSCAQALANLKTAMQVNNDFTFWTNKSVTANFSLKHPENTRSILGGQSGSILDVYGTGEYEFDNYDVKLWLHRGSDKGVTIRYGKNLTDIKASLDSGDAYTTIVPYWVSQDGATVVNGDPVYSEHETEVAGFSTVAMDFSGDFTEAPTKAQLMTRAAQYLEDNRPWELKENLTVSFVALADTEEYKDIASLETVNLCDTVHIFHPKLGITATAKVVKTKWDSLRERYIEIELGTPKTSLAQAIKPVTKTDLTNQAVQTSNFLLDSMAELIDALSGASGGHVIFHREADGHISEIYIMDTDDAATATNVLRINYLGIYASTTGINGTYNLAITTGGTINASQVLAGVLQGIEIIAQSGEIGGFSIGTNNLSFTFTYNYPTYTQADIDKAQLYISDPVANPLTPDELIEYDVNMDGAITSADLLAMSRMIAGTVDSYSSGVCTLSTADPKNIVYIEITEGYGSGRYVSIGVGGVKSSGTVLAQTFNARGKLGTTTQNVWGSAYKAEITGGIITGLTPTGVGTTVNGSLINVNMAASWTDAMQISLGAGTWIIVYGCQITGIGGVTLALSTNYAKHRVSCSAPTAHTYWAKGCEVVTLSAQTTVTVRTWSANLSSFDAWELYAYKIGG